MSARTGPSNDPAFKVTHRTERSIPTFLLHKFLRPIRHLLLKAGEPMPAGSPRLHPNRRAHKLCEISERQVDDIWIYDLTAKKPVPPSTPNTDKTSQPRRIRIFYFAGGGWQLPATGQHFNLCASIASQVPNSTLSLISYPLAPASPAPTSFPQLSSLYKSLLASSAAAGEIIVLAGDSAGGNIALCLPLHALSQDPAAAVPDAILALSPSTDLRRGNPDITSVSKHDPILTVPFIKSTANTYRGSWDAFDPRVSPLAAELKTLAARKVAVYGMSGTYDLLGPDAGIFRERCQEAGVTGEWLLWEKQMHVWVLTARYGFPESKAALKWLVDVLARVKPRPADTQIV